MHTKLNVCFLVPSLWQLDYESSTGRCSLFVNSEELPQIFPSRHPVRDVHQEAENVKNSLFTCT